jgi:hypothetical protein
MKAHSRKGPDAATKSAVAANLPRHEEWIWVICEVGRSGRITAM